MPSTTMHDTSENGTSQWGATGQTLTPAHTKGVSQLTPLLVALGLIAATALVSLLISGTMP